MTHKPDSYKLDHWRQYLTHKPDSYKLDHWRQYPIELNEYVPFDSDYGDVDPDLVKEVAHMLENEMEELMYGRLLLPTGGVTARKRSEFFDGRNTIRLID